MVLDNGPKPWRQGSLDALCGPYSLANALVLVNGRLGEAKASEAAWRLLDALSRKRELSQVWHQGAGIGDMLLMVKEGLCKHYPVKASRPFSHAANTNLGTYWRMVQHFLDRGPNRAVVLVMDSWNYSHWTLARSATQYHFDLFDSFGRKRLFRRHCTTKTMSQSRPVKLYPAQTIFLTGERWLG